MIIIGSDHAGFETKEYIKEYLKTKKINFKDVGVFSEKKADYPLIAKRVAKIVAKHKKYKGILVCGTGTGMCIGANRIKGIRAAIIYDKYSAEMSRQDNDANVACLRGRKFSKRKALKLLLLWLSTAFKDGARYKKRIRMLDS